MDGVKIATKMEIIPIEEKGKKTIMTIEKLDVHQSLDAIFYSKQNMKRVK